MVKMNWWRELSLNACFEGNYYLIFVFLYLNSNCYGNLRIIVTIEWSSLVIIIANFSCWLINISVCVACFCLFWLTFDFLKGFSACVTLVFLVIYRMQMLCLFTRVFLLYLKPSALTFKMTFISQLEASSSRHPMIHSCPLLLS